MPRYAAFDIFHPGVVLGYFALVIILTMLAIHPVYLVISFVGALLLNAYLRGWHALLRTLVWQLPLILFITLVNPFFSAAGSTEIFRLGFRAIYAESLIFGACMGTMLVAMMLWFSNASQVISGDKVMTVLGNAFPTLSLMMAMIARLIPKFLSHGSEIKAVHEVVDLSETPGKWKRRLSEGIRLSSVLMAWSMEDSIDTSNAMRARGYGAKTKRSRYARYRFRRYDAVAAASLLFLAAVNGYLLFSELSHFAFYPVIHGLSFDGGYIPFLLLVALPFIVIAGDGLRWLRT